MSLGPLLVTVSFFWYSRFNSLTVENPWLNNSNFFSLVGFFVPVTSIWLALTLLFYKLPSAKVKLQDAALGALFSAVTFEIVKRAFASYITLSTTYSTIYGVLTTVPIFLFWLYITWIVVLYGAEISYQAGAIKILHNISKYATDLGEIGAILGLRILYCIGKRFCDGVLAPTESEIAI